MGIKRKLSDIVKNDFIRSVSVLFSGSALAQIIYIVFGYFFGKLYNSQQAAIFFNFSFVLNITTQIACLKYDFAIVVADSEEEANGLFLICNILSAVISLALLLLILPLNWFISPLLGLNTAPFTLFLIPATTFIYAMFQTFSYFSIRHKNFKAISSANIVNALVTSVGQIVLAWMGWGYWGLIVSQMVSYIFSNIILFVSFKDYICFKDLDFKKLKSYAYKHQRFPKYTMLSSVVNNVTNSIQSLLITKSYSLTESGYYGTINKVLGMPLTTISGTVSQTFLKHAADRKNDGESLAKTFNRVTKYMALICIVPFGMLILFAKPVTLFYLDKKWLPVADYLVYLVPLFVVRFVVGPITSSALVMKKQRAAMIWQFGLLFCALLPSIIKMFYPISYTVYLTIFAAAMSVAYIIFYFFCYNLVKNNAKETAEENDTPVKDENHDKDQEN